MPITEPILSHIRKTKEAEKVENLVKDIINGVIQLSETLSFLHAKQITHRDIKPSNVYFYNGRYCLGDFGLVDFPDNDNDFTKSTKGLGAIFTIAPEMKRNPKEADGKSADVFSLAKTMWMLLSGDELGFDGQYNFLDKSHGLHFMQQYKNLHLVELEEVLEQATNNDPILRPDINSFKQKLKEWLCICEDNEKAQASEWKFLNRRLFRDNPPESIMWRDKNKIINILNIIGTLSAYNHMLFSDKGGLDFEKAEMANEDGCIYIYAMGYCFLLKPKCLRFEGFKENYIWNYFLLEIDELSPVFDSNVLDYEFLVEDYPAHYVSARYAQYGVYDYDSGKQLPDNYKVVNRYLKGKFLIILKSGPYNKINSTYDGRHGMCSSDEFRSYIEDLIVKFNKSYEAQPRVQQDCILQNEEFDDNPFCTEESVSVNDQLKKDEKIEQFISDNYCRWSFKSILINETKHGKIAFYIIFKQSEAASFSSYFSHDILCLCSNGKIKKMNNKDLHEVYYIYDRERAITVSEKCLDFIAAKCVKNNLGEPATYRSFFSIELKRIGKPTHLFSKQEIADAMRRADDRNNNTLVIDENGYVKIINNKKQATLYPVRLETWCAGNQYVGKYSDLGTLEETYRLSLQGWLYHLKFGKVVYADYFLSDKNEELLKAIRQYY
jgi:serine/threonine protein kinase